MGAGGGRCAEKALEAQRIPGSPGSHSCPSLCYPDPGLMVKGWELPPARTWGTEPAPSASALPATCARPRRVPGATPGR